MSEAIKANPLPRGKAEMPAGGSEGSQVGRSQRRLVVKRNVPKQPDSANVKRSLEGGEQDEGDAKKNGPGSLNQSLSSAFFSTLREIGGTENERTPLNEVL